MPPGKPKQQVDTAVEVAPSLCSHCREPIDYKWGSKGASCGLCGSRVHHEDCARCPKGTRNV